jgi:prevent-host-death family protein
MTIHVNIAEAKARLSELLQASLDGEVVILAKAGRPIARITPLEEAQSEERKKIAERRRSAFGMYKHLVGDSEIEVTPLMTEEEQEASWTRKFGPPA